MGGLGGGTSSSTPTTVYTPGLFGAGSTANGGVPAQDLMNQYLGTMGLNANAGGVTGSLNVASPFTQQNISTSPLSMQSATATQSNINPNVSSVYERSLQDALLNPSFNPTAAQTAVINRASDMTNASSAARGLGASSDLEKLSAVAPLINQMQQQNVSNLTGAAQNDIGNKLAMNQFGLAQNNLNNQWGQNAVGLNNQSNLNAANWLTGAQTAQAGLNNQMATGNLGAQQQQMQNVMTALGLITPGSTVAAQTSAFSEGKPGASAAQQPMSNLINSAFNPQLGGLPQIPQLGGLPQIPQLGGLPQIPQLGGLPIGPGITTGIPGLGF